MSAVGSEAASMLEKALEEMDDIFKEAGQPTVYHSPRHHTGEIGNNLDSIRILIENFEGLLVENNYPSGIKRQEAEALFHLASKLSYFMLFIEDAVDHLVSFLCKIVVMMILYIHTGVWQSRRKLPKRLAVQLLFKLQAKYIFLHYLILLASEEKY